MMVGTTGIEPVTPAMSMQCSPAELRSLYNPRFTAFRGCWQAGHVEILQIMILHVIMGEYCFMTVAMPLFHLGFARDKS